MLDDKARKAISKQLDDSVDMLIKESIEIDSARASNNLGFSSDTSTTLIMGKSKHSEIIAECEAMYRTVGMVRNIIDLMADFATEGIDIVVDDQEEQNFYQSWARRIRLQNRAEHIARTYFKTANVAIYGIHGKLDAKTINNMKSEGRHTDGFSEDKVENKTIPIRYEIYNPRNLQKTGPTGFKIVKTKIDDSLVKIIHKKKKDLDKTEKLILSKIPERFRQEVKDSKKKRNIFVTLGFEVNDPRLTMIHYKKDDWQDWADPLIFAILDDLKFKKTLRAADKQAAQNIIDALTIIKIGDTTAGFPPTKTQFTKLAQLMKTPVNTKTILWNDLISIETAYPPVDKILGDAKYKAVNNDILAGFGVSQVIVNGEGGNYSNSFLSVKTLLEKLETIRSEIFDWLYKELKLIKKAMKFKSTFHIRFGQMSLRDEAAEKALIIQLVDRNIISSETALEHFGESFLVELSRMKAEKEKRDSFLIKKNSPVERNPDMNKQDRGEDDFDSKGPGQPGRPKNVKTPQKVERDTLPVGLSSNDMADLLLFKEKALQLYQFVEDSLSDIYCKDNDVKHKKSLLKKQKDELDKKIFSVFSNIGVNSNVDEDLIASLSHKQVDEYTAGVFESLINKIKDTPSLQRIRDLRATAYVIARYGDLKDLDN